MSTRMLTPVRVRHHLRREEDSDAREQKLRGETKHHSVMTREVVSYLNLKKGDVIVDATYGVGGHARALKAAAKISLIAIDADPAAGEGVVEANFADIEKVVKKQGFKKINKVVFDLGWNREQLASGRGFSFMHDEPLNMSYGAKPASGFNASELLNTWSEKDLSNVFFGYGEERFARRIARAVVIRREMQPLSTTLELAELVKDAVPASYRHGRIHPATKVFQALRIAVNDELKSLERGLAGAWRILQCGSAGAGGRIAVISFHSIEDRVVKNVFKDFAKHHGRLLVKKPLVASASEVASNPSARSAKLRVIEKVCNEK